MWPSSVSRLRLSSDLPEVSITFLSFLFPFFSILCYFGSPAKCQPDCLHGFQKVKCAVVCRGVIRAMVFPTQKASLWGWQIINDYVISASIVCDHPLCHCGSLLLFSCVLIDSAEPRFQTTCTNLWVSNDVGERRRHFCICVGLTQIREGKCLIANVRSKRSISRYLLWWNLQSPMASSAKTLFSLIYFSADKANLNFMHNSK